MTIGKKLYTSFGAILAMVVVLFLVNVTAMYRERSTKAAAAQALQMADLTDAIRFQMMQNRLYLSNYLLSGDTREVDRMKEGEAQLDEKLSQATKLANSDQEKAALEKVQKTEQAWATEFAAPLLDKRKDVDSGNATVAELQVFYLQKDASSWVKASTDTLALADQENTKTLDERRHSDETASNWTIILSLLSTVVALGLGAVIAYRTAQSITQPLKDLMKVAEQIGKNGDLDHEVDIRRDDEIGQLARTFTGMVQYLREMAALSEAIAGGNLTVEVQPRSKSDTLGNAFVLMIEGLRNLVRSVRDASSQVASASTQV